MGSCASTRGPQGPAQLTTPHEARPSTVDTPPQPGKTCVKALLVDEHESDVIYSGSWDGLARSYHLSTGELQRTYAGCHADIIDLAQCTTPAGEHLLFAAPCGMPGVCCWKRGTAQLVAVFTTRAALPSAPVPGFSAYALAATPTTLFCGHAFEGVLSWDIPDRPSQHGVVTLPRPRFFGSQSPFPTSVGPATLVSSNGAMSLALSPDGQRLASGHIVDLSTVVSTPERPARHAPARSAAEATAVNMLQLGGEYGALIWDSTSGEAVGLLGFHHHAALRAVIWVAEDSVVTGDLNGVALLWNASAGIALRQLITMQRRVRALSLLAPAADARADPEAMPRITVLSGSDGGPPLVAHDLPAEQTDDHPDTAPNLLNLTAPTLDRDPPSFDPTTFFSHAPPRLRAREVLATSEELPEDARDSLYSVAQTDELYITGHYSGAIFVWSRETGAQVAEFGTLPARHIEAETYEKAASRLPHGRVRTEVIKMTLAVTEPSGELQLAWDAHSDSDAEEASEQEIMALEG
eukprot:CAMPEP_0185162266 /NCGR_PEP_ID=MMETSP1139-20130426/6262_1 /TAXON_ID=298111 /ORGANISM="Pavlova sp., Strain CCMP459" /LENGTH=521 /DNA_ID=CAMNT_0027727583 /DNA_START=57 /DNA_END=1620 /DNA_ORIENTATION=-